MRARTHAWGNQLARLQIFGIFTDELLKNSALLEFFARTEFSSSNQVRRLRGGCRRCWVVAAGELRTCLEIKPSEPHPLGKSQNPGVWLEGGIVPGSVWQGTGTGHVGV